MYVDLEEMYANRPRDCVWMGIGVWEKTTKKCIMKFGGAVLEKFILFSREKFSGDKLVNTKFIIILISNNVNYLHFKIYFSSFRIKKSLFFFKNKIKIFV